MKHIRYSKNYIEYYDSSIESNIRIGCIHKQPIREGKWNSESTGDRVRKLI